MRYQVVKTFRVRTRQGDRELSAGQIVELSLDKARSLMSTGKIEAILSEEQRYDFDEHAVIMEYDGCLSGKQVEKGEENMTDLLIAGLAADDHGTFKNAYRIFSDILQTHLWVVTGKEDMETLRKQGISEPVYTREEIRKLMGADGKELKAVHMAKEVFENAEVDEVILRAVNRDWVDK
jgi:hypothetical protein